MKRFTFDEVTDFDTFFSGNNPEVTDAIVSGIQEAIEESKDSADCFELGFHEEDDFFVISLPKSEWNQALSACMKKYEDAEKYNDVIDTYNLLKTIKSLV